MYRAAQEGPSAIRTHPHGMLKLRDPETADDGSARPASNRRESA